jgi:hypothetical protein
MNACCRMSVLLIVGLVWTSIPASARELSAPRTVREILEEARAANADVTVELEGGMMVSGPVGSTNKRRFYILDGTARSGRAIAYASTRALIDPGTGERLTVQAPGPSSRMPRPHPSLKAWLVVGAVVGVFIIWVYATGFNRA